MSNDTSIQSNLESNIYNLFLAIAESSGRNLNTENSIKWVKTYPSCWPNYIFYTDSGISGIEDKIQVLKKEIKSGNAPNSWFLGPQAASNTFYKTLKKNGFIKAFSWPGMLLENKKMNSVIPVLEEFKIKQVNTKDELIKWSDIISDGMFGSCFEGVELFKNMLKREDMKLFLGFFKEKPVSTSLLHLNSDIAGLFLVTTLPGYREMGFGTRITIAPIKESIKHGYKYSGLFATASGERVYKKIGFKRCCDFDVFYI
jgi:hypothetical protein